MSCSTCGYTGTGDEHNDPSDCVTVLLGARAYLLNEVRAVRTQRDQAFAVVQAMVEGLDEFSAITKAAMAEARRGDAQEERTA